MRSKVSIECTGRIVILDTDDLEFLEANVNPRFEYNVTFPSGFTVNAAEMAELQEGMREIMAD
jgi:hypothetical protein